LADWPQLARTKILADFNLADSGFRSSHAQNLPARARLQLATRVLASKQAAYKGIIFPEYLKFDHRQEIIENEP
jgi:hypothetical protein